MDSKEYYQWITDIVTFFTVSFQMDTTFTKMFDLLLYDYYSMNIQALVIEIYARG